MRRIFARILKALRSVLSRFGFTSPASSTPDNDRLRVHPSEPPWPSDGGVCETPGQEQLEAGKNYALQESKGEGSVEAVQEHGGGDVRETEADSEGGGPETAHVSFQLRQETASEDAAECGARSEEAKSEGVISPASLRDEHVQGGQALRTSGGRMERDSTFQQPQRDVEEPAETPRRNGETNDASVEQNVTVDTDGTRYSSPNDEISHEASAPPIVLDHGTSDEHEDESGPARAEDVGAGDGIANPELAEEDAHQEEGAPSAGPAEPPVVESEPVIDASTANASGQSAPESDSPLSTPADMPSEDLRGRVDSSEEQATISVDTPALSSGCVDRQPLEGDDEEPAQGDRRAPSPRRPTPPEDASEYVAAVQGVSAVDREYARWNRLIVEQLLLTTPSSEEAYLCVNPRILARVSEESGFGFLTPEQAEQQFSTAVANVYQRRVLGHSARLRVLRRCSGGGPPDCTAFLAGSVLAAFHMQSDEEASGNAYYKRLADLLACGRQGVYPVGFDPAVFESLWMFLGNWLHEVHGRRLAMPRGDVGFRRFVALPLAHVPLRSLDVDRLPAFFSWAGYQPGGRVRHERLLSDLKRWQQSRNVLTPTGSEALSDDRSAAVAAQVSAELESWDGSLYESATRRSALVEIQFDVVQRSPAFFYLPRRPPGFPEVFDGGERVFEASDEGWYDPARVRPEDGDLLESGFEWPSNVNGVRFALRRPGAVVVALTPSSICSGFLSNRRLLRGVRCSVLFRNDVLSTVKEYLSEVAQSTLNPVSHPLLPNGWAIFRDFTARVHVEAPPGFEALEVDPNVELIVAGGLRVGRRWSWLAGAPPRILVSGVEAQDSIKVNGTPVEVGVNGELPTGGLFAAPGEYTIEAGRVRRRIEIAQPQVSVWSEADQLEPIDGRLRRIALPHGSWTLIGPSADQVCQSHGGFFRGTIASCPFEPSWAVQVGAGPGAVVAALANPSPPRTISLHRLTGQARKVVEIWASAIYEAHIRRPRLIGLDGAPPAAGAADTWRRYTALAKEIKRRLKRQR